MVRDTVLVELDEGPADEPPPAADTGQRGRRRLRRRWLPLLALAVLVGVLGGAQGLVNARQREAWFALAARSDAVLRPLTPTLTATAVGDLPLQLWSAAAYRDLVIGLVGTSDGSLQAVAADVDTWQVRWRQTLDGPRTGLAAGDTRWAEGTCRAVSDDAAVVCLVDDALVVERSDGTTTLQAATAHRIVVLDARTGAVRVQHEVTGDVLGDLALLPGLAVVAVVDDSPDPAARAVDLVAVGLDDGVQRWRTATSAVVDMTAGVSTQVREIGTDVAFVTAQWSTSGSTSSSVTFVAADGAVRRAVSGLAVPAWVVSSGNRSFVEVSGERTTVLTPDGDVSLPGGVTTAAVDDGSLGTIWFTSGAAFDAAGTRRWAMPAGANSYLAPAVLRGTVYVAADDQVIAIDGATGTERWRTERIGEAIGQLLTDGSVLAAVTGPGGLPAGLVAFDLQDGRREWEGALPTGLGGVFAQSHLLVGYPATNSATTVLQ